MKQQTEILFRQIAMLRMIPRKGGITARQIHQLLADDGFSVDLRTVQRDLKTFTEYGLFPLDVDESSKPHQWYWQTDAVIEIPTMSGSEALAFVMLDRHLQGVLPPNLLSSIQPHVQHAEKLLQQHRHQRLARWSEKIAMLPRALRFLPAKVDHAIQENVLRALLDEKQLDVVYQPRAEDARGYVLNPLSLVVQDGVMFLVASANDYNDPLHFVLHRFKSAEVSTKAARIPPDFSLKQHLQSQAFDFPLQEKLIRLVAIFDRYGIYHLHETPLSEDQSLEAYAEGLEKLTATVMDTLALRRWLLGFGERVEILEPLELREEFAHSAAEMHAKYNPAESAAWGRAPCA